MRRAAIFAALLAAGCFAAPGVSAESPKAAAAKASPLSSSRKVGEVVRRLQARYDATKDFTADFQQSVEVATLGKTLESSGHLFFKRPGRMRWEFIEPEKQTIIADGTELSLYQPEHRQLLKAPFRAAFQSATPVSFLFGVGELASDFDSSLVESARPEILRLKLVPKQEREIGILILDLDPRRFDIVGAEITDPLGNVTRLRFSNMQRDVGLKSDTFAFHPPPGTDIVEAPGSP